MEKHKNLFEQFVTFENQYNGYLLARRNKRYKEAVLSYSANLEENLINGINRLIWKEYQVERMHEFMEYYPKKRIIAALPFADRVINCAAYNILCPIYSKSYYEHSYGSIAGRGPIRAAKQLQYWMRLVSNKSGQWWLCKADIAKFFFRIPFDVQIRELSRPIDDPDMMWFLEMATRGTGQAFGIPLEAKDVENCARIQGIGMPVGSLISQLTANVVMTPADHYMKRVIRIPYYIRYMDDMIFLAPSKAEIHDALDMFKEFLISELGLVLNNKTVIMRADAGVEFVGKRIWPDKIQLRKSTSLHMKQHLNYIKRHYSTGEIPYEYTHDVIVSYLGLMKHCNCDALRRKVLDDFALIRQLETI